MSVLNVKLYGLVDPEHTGDRDLLTLTNAIVEGGVTLVQLRDKQGDMGAKIERARAVKRVLEGTGVPLIINDRVDIALAVGADGVHLGQEDMPASIARRLLGTAAIIGETVHSMEEADAVSYEATDYVGLGGIFTTTSKNNKSAPIGVDGLNRIAARIRHHRQDMKICAIAGIGEDNAGAVIRAGADGVAVISALSASSDPQAAATELLRIVDDELAGKGDL